MYFTPYAPHEPAIPAPRHETAFSDLAAWRPASYNEADVSDKPAWGRTGRLWGETKQAKVDAFRLSQLRSLPAVDEAVARIVAALERTGRLSNTMIAYMGDNGFAWGEHRLRGELMAYEESIRVPFVLRYDPLVSLGRADEHFVLNIDVAPTAAEIAGVTTPAVDGQSPVPLLTNARTAWRTDFLVERLKKPGSRVPSYCAVRGKHAMLIEYETGELELYDLTQDPFELSNLASEPKHAPMLGRLTDRLRDLCSSPPPGTPLPL